jgi:hypothetical protein
MKPDASSYALRSMNDSAPMALVLQPFKDRFEPVFLLSERTA